jgi:hypothetical protein
MDNTNLDINTHDIPDDDSCDTYQELINKYIEYYKKAYPEKNIKNMFHDINFDDQTSTNHIMEMFYTEILKFNKIDNNVYTNSDDFDKTKFNELFGLKINDEIKCVSFCVISLLIEVINNDYKDWNVINLN